MCALSLCHRHDDANDASSSRRSSGPSGNCTTSDTHNSPASITTWTVSTDSVDINSRRSASNSRPTTCSAPTMVRHRHRPMPIRRAKVSGQQASGRPQLLPKRKDFSRMDRSVDSEPRLRTAIRKVFRWDHMDFWWVNNCWLYLVNSKYKCTSCLV